jgi:hypothetical protein
MILADRSAPPTPRKRPQAKVADPGLSPGYRTDSLMRLKRM